MNSEWFKTIPEAQRDAARASVAAVLGPHAAPSIQTVVGGVSGALTYRLDWNQSAYLMRLETRRSPMRNPHQYACMKIASDAGIAPPLRYVDDSTGVAILDFVTQRPLGDYPGGPAALAAAVGKLAFDLQNTPAFPHLGDYRVFTERMLSFIQRGFGAGLLDPHKELFERIREAYPWDSSRHVSSHNDPNPGNILYDGQRLWLIDWETSYRNDPFTDVAILAENFAPTTELETILVTSWLGAPPNRFLRARLLLMRHMTRLYYAGLLCAFTAAAPQAEPITDLSAPTPDEFRSQLAAGVVKMGEPEMKVSLAKMLLAGFLAGSDGTAVAGGDGIALEDALAICRAG